MSGGRRVDRLYAAVLTTALMLQGAAVDAEPAAVPPPAAVSSSSALDEVVVTGERAGPGLWHVYKGSAQLWILGSVSPLPKDMTWRSKQLEAILDGTDQVLVAKPVEMGVARVVWLMLTQRELFMNGGGRKLRDVMPADLHARFAAQRAKFTDDPNKWEKYRPAVASLFLQEAALHQVGLSTRLDVGSEVRGLARKHHVRIEEFKIAGIHDVLDALKTLPPATENSCVAAGLATIESGLPRLVERGQAWATGNVERMQSLPEPAEVGQCRAAVMLNAGAGDLLALMRRTWLANMERNLQNGGVTLAVVSMDMLLARGGFLDELRAAGYTVDAP
jgi:uncharacterized protein YbaP (TraB family)